MKTDCGETGPNTRKKRKKKERGSERVMGPGRFQNQYRVTMFLFLSF